MILATPVRVDRPTHTRWEEQGFSLAELMLGMVVSVLVIGATLSMASQHARHRKVNEEIHLALVACRDNLERLRTTPVTSLLSQHGVGFDVLGKNGAPAGLAPLPGDPDGLPGQFTVIEDQSTGGEAIYLVRASVVWSGSRRRQIFELETLMGPRE